MIIEQNIFEKIELLYRIVIENNIDIERTFYEFEDYITIFPELYRGMGLDEEIQQEVLDLREINCGASYTRNKEIAEKFSCSSHGCNVNALFNIKNAEGIYLTDIYFDLFDNISERKVENYAMDLLAEIYEVLYVEDEVLVRNPRKVNKVSKIDEGNWIIELK